MIKDSLLLKINTLHKLIMIFALKKMNKMKILITNYIILMELNTKIIHGLNFIKIHRKIELNLEDSLIQLMIQKIFHLI